MCHRNFTDSMGANGRINEITRSGQTRYMWQDYYILNFDHIESLSVDGLMELK